MDGREGYWLRLSDMAVTCEVEEESLSDESDLCEPREDDCRLCRPGDVEFGIENAPGRRAGLCVAILLTLFVYYSDSSLPGDYSRSSGVEMPPMGYQGIIDKFIHVHTPTRRACFYEYVCKLQKYVRLL